MKLPPINLVIFEGPSGSGKTTAIEEVMRKYPLDYEFIQTENEIRRPRAYTDYQGVALSQAKDEYGFLLAVQEWFRGLPDAPSPVWPILDRFLLSQWVYGTMRDNRIELDQREGISIINTAADWMQTSLQAFTARGLYPFHIKNAMKVPIHLHFLFIIPDPEVLEENRQTRGLEKYPYSTVHELSMYSAATDAVAEVIRGDYLEYLKLNYRVFEGKRDQIWKDCLSWLDALKSHPKR